MNNNNEILENKAGRAMQAMSQQTAQKVEKRGRLFPAMVRGVRALLAILMLGIAANAWAVTSTTTLTSSPNPSVVGQTVTFTATVTGSSPTGSVSFNLAYPYSGVLGTAPVNNGVATLHYTFNSAFSWPVFSQYSGDANNSWSSSSTITQTVSTLTTTTVLTSNLNPSAPNQSVTLTATVTGYNPTSGVTFYDGSTFLGWAPVVSGVATLNYTFTTLQAHNLTANYAGDANNQPSSSTLTQNVAKATSTTTLTSGLNPSAIGQAVTLTAHVTGSSPAGTVTFMDGTTTLGTGTLTGGTATLNATFGATGTHNLTAVYGGDANNNTSTSAAVSQSVAGVATTTTLTASPSPSAAGQAITLTATVTGSSPSGTVTFMDGANTLGTGTITAGTATLSYALATAGTHSLTAVYAGDANNASSTSTAVTQTVNPATTTVTLTSGLNPSAWGNSVTFTATVAGASPTGIVTFKDGTTTLGTGTVTAGTATFNYAFTSVGAHSLTASYAGDANNAPSTSAAVTQTVNTAVTTTALTSSANPILTGQPVTLTATVAGVSPTGTVTFMDGTTAIGTGTLTGSTATLSAGFNTKGTHNLTAVYGGDANNSTSTSTAVSETVNGVTTSTTLTTSPNPSATGQAIALTATVTGSSPTGTVTFMDGTATIGTATLANGTCTLSYTFTTAGTHLLTANYGGDAASNSSTSPIANQSVAGQAATYYYIQADQLDTPRAITDTQGNTVWQWDNTDPYGNNVPNENPSNQGQFSFNLRFAGQYFDKETSLNYNRFRDYNAAIGGYIESDLIGLKGGVNTFAYVSGNPLSFTDPLGLKTLCEALREMAAKSDTNVFFNGTPFEDIPSIAGGHVIPEGGNDPDIATGHPGHFTHDRDGLEYDTQYVEVGWALTKAKGSMMAEAYYWGYSTLSPSLGSLWEWAFNKGKGFDWAFYTSRNLGANGRGFNMGSMGAVYYSNFKDFVKDLCPEKCSSCSK